MRDGGGLRIKENKITVWERKRKMKERDIERERKNELVLVVFFSFTN